MIELGRLTYIAFECFQQKKEDILNTSIPTRSKAHDIIRRMLASLGDPYTRFLSPEEVISHTCMYLDLEISLKWYQKLGFHKFIDIDQCA